MTANINSERAALVLLTLPEQQDLEAKHVRLIAENKELRRKLLLFQQLFRNKERLRGVVKRLGVDVVE